VEHPGYIRGENKRKKRKGNSTKWLGHLMAQLGKKRIKRYPPKDHLKGNRKCGEAHGRAKIKKRFGGGAWKGI